MNPLIRSILMVIAAAAALLLVVVLIDMATRPRSHGAFPSVPPEEEVLVLDLAYRRGSLPPITLRGWRIVNQYGPRLQPQPAEWTLRVDVADGEPQFYGLLSPLRVENLDILGTGTATPIAPPYVEWSLAIPLYVAGTQRNATRVRLYNGERESVFSVDLDLAQARAGSATGLVQQLLPLATLSPLDWPQLSEQQSKSLQRTEPHRHLEVGQ